MLSVYFDTLCLLISKPLGSGCSLEGYPCTLTLTAMSTLYLKGDSVRTARIVDTKRTALCPRRPAECDGLCGEQTDADCGQIQVPDDRFIADFEPVRGTALWLERDGAVDAERAVFGGFAV